MSELLTTKEIAEYLKLRKETVLRKVRKREMPAIKVGGRFRFDKEQIDEWLRSKSTTAQRHIMIIDDEEIIRQLFKETLENSGYHVITARNGIEALELVNWWNFDLIFTDLKMPEMNGAEVFRRIRQIDSSVPIVIITGYPISELMEQALKQGPFGVMNKPFDAMDIQKAADSFLRGASARDTLTESFKKMGYV